MMQELICCGELMLLTPADRLAVLIVYSQSIGHRESRCERRLHDAAYCSVKRRAPLNFAMCCGHAALLLVHNRQRYWTTVFDVKRLKQATRTTIDIEVDELLISFFFGLNLSRE